MEILERALATLAEYEEELRESLGEVGEALADQLSEREREE